MSKKTAEDFMGWVTPDEHEIVGHVQALEEMELLRTFVQDERQQWLLAQAHREIARHQQEAGDAPQADQPEASFDFKNVRLQPAITLSQHKSLIDADALPRIANLDQGARYSYWETVASVEAHRQGFEANLSKYSDVYQPSWFDMLYERSKEVTDSGVPIRVLMNGTQYLAQGAIDLTSIQEWLDGEYTYQVHRWLTNQLPLKQHWADVVKAWQEQSDALGYTSYDDVVEEVADGIYVAPFIPQEVVASRQFVTFDDLARAFARQGQTVNQGTSRAFKDMLRIIAPNEASLHDLHQKVPNNPKYSGVVFFDKAKLLPIIESVNASTQKPGVAARMAEHILSSLSPELVITEDDRFYEQLIFGRHIEPGVIVPSYGTADRIQRIPRFEEPKAEAPEEAADEDEIEAAQPSTEEPRVEPRPRLPLADRRVSPEAYTIAQLLKLNGELISDLTNFDKLDSTLELLDELRDAKIAQIKADFAQQREKVTEESLREVIRLQSEVIEKYGKIIRRQLDIEE